MINHLIDRIKLRQIEIQKSTAEGVPPTWEQYQRLVGENQGLQSVLDFIDNMLEEERNAD